jgi:hypothetical protein
LPLRSSTEVAVVVIFTGELPEKTALVLFRVFVVKIPDMTASPSTDKVSWEFTVKEKRNRMMRRYSAFIRLVFNEGLKLLTGFSGLVFTCNCHLHLLQYFPLVECRDCTVLAKFSMEQPAH